MTRKERRDQDPEVQKKRTELANILGFPKDPSGVTGKGHGGGWGVGDGSGKPASGTAPATNPFVIPKAAGLNTISQTFPSSYYVDWNLSTWRSACDQVTKSGYPVLYSAMVSWVYECSPFVVSLFEKLGAAVGRIKFFMVDANGNKMDDLTAEICNKPWCLQLRKEIMFSFFWGFTGLNFDPVAGKIYKYPLQQIDPINRMLRASTFSFYDGVNFDETDNLLFIQPSTSYEAFLGWMQQISRSFIQMNSNKNSWGAAGRRVAFPILTVGYPQNDGAVNADGVQINPYKQDAELIAANTNPQNGLVYPYTIDSSGNIIKSIEIDFEQPGTAANTHKIFQEFNNDEKNEIREMIFGGTLTSNSDGKGSYALGEVHENMFDAVVADKLEFILSTLNIDFIPKISKFYKNFPKGVTFDVDQTKKLTIEEMKALSDVIVANGKRLSDTFFEANGISRDFIEYGPEPVIQEEEVEVKASGLKKKVY